MDEFRKGVQRIQGNTNGFRFEVFHSLFPWIRLILFF